MWLSWVSSNSNFFPHASHSNTCRLVPSSLISFRDKSTPGSLIFSRWGSSEPLWLFPLCILRPLSGLKAFPHISHLNVSSPFCCTPQVQGFASFAGMLPFAWHSFWVWMGWISSWSWCLDVLSDWYFCWLMLIDADADWCFCRLMLMLWPLAVTPGVTQ